MKIIALTVDYKQKYLNKYGHHFNQKLCNFATSLMQVDNKGTKTNLEVITKDQLDFLLKVNNISIKYTNNYDYVYVANMCKADFLGKSVPDQIHLLHYVKDMIEDVDAYDGYIFNRWLTDVDNMDIEIDWKKML